MSLRTSFYASNFQTDYIISTGKKPLVKIMTKLSIEENMWQYAITHMILPLLIFRQKEGSTTSAKKKKIPKLILKTELTLAKNN